MGGKNVEFDIKSNQSTDALSKILTRRRAEILQLIASGKFSLGEIESQLKINRSFLTDAIGILQTLGIIEIEKIGRKKYPILIAQKIIIRLRE